MTNDARKTELTEDAWLAALATAWAAANSAGKPTAELAAAIAQQLEV